MPKIRWWKGTHGEWYMVAQVALIVLVFFGQSNLPAGSYVAAPLLVS
jgi:hypothetical protein